MPEQYQVDRAKEHIRLARYLMSKADERGTTHGEKHHIIQVCLSEMCAALFYLGDDSYSVVSQNADTDPKQVRIHVNGDRQDRF